jgi:hypothetical protein
MNKHLKDNICFKENEEYYKKQNEDLEIALRQEILDIEAKLKGVIEAKAQNIQIQNQTNNIQNNNNQQANLTMNILTKEYITQHFNNDPCLKPLDNYDDIRIGNMITDPYYDDENVMFVNTVLCQYECGKLVEYFGKILLSFYKNKADISKQSLWCSDLSRLKFLVRILPTDSTTNAWITDPSGITVKDKIIKPLLDYVVTCIDEYSIKYPSKMISETEKFLTLGNIVTSIRNGSITNHIARYIAPHFTLGKQLTNKT